MDISNQGLAVHSVSGMTSSIHTNGNIWPMNGHSCHAQPLARGAPRAGEGIATELEAHTQTALQYDNYDIKILPINLTSH